MSTKKTCSILRTRRGAKATRRIAAYKPINVVHMFDFFVARGRADSGHYQHLCCMEGNANNVGSAQRRLNEVMQHELRVCFPV